MATAIIMVATLIVVANIASLIINDEKAPLRCKKYLRAMKKERFTATKNKKESRD
jgi:hypothetical protein